jgi:hypothetical protein
MWQFIIVGTKERFEGHTHSQPPPSKYIHKLGGLSSIHLKHRRGAQGLMWGARGPFLPVAAIVVADVMPVVFCAKANEKCNENTKISCLDAIILFKNIFCKTYYNSYSANCSMARARVEVWPKPKPLWSNGPWHIGYQWKAFVIVRTINRLY